MSVPPRRGMSVRTPGLLATFHRRLDLPLSPLLSDIPLPCLGSDLLHLPFQISERGIAASAPRCELVHHARYAPRGYVAQGRNGSNDNGLVGRVEGGCDEVIIYRLGDEMFEIDRVLKVEAGAKGCVAQVGLGRRRRRSLRSDCEEGEQLKLSGLCIRELW